MPQPRGSGGGEGGSQGGSGVKRKRGSDSDSRRDSLPHFLQEVKTPETPYGGPEASSKSRKYWKKVYDDMGKRKWTEEEKREHTEHMKKAEEYADERQVWSLTKCLFSYKSCDCSAEKKLRGIYSTVITKQTKKFFFLLSKEELYYRRLEVTIHHNIFFVSTKLV